MSVSQVFVDNRTGKLVNANLSEISIDPTIPDPLSLNEVDANIIRAKNPMQEGPQLADGAIIPATKRLRTDTVVGADGTSAVDIAGGLTSTDGTFSGNLMAVDGTFSGDVTDNGNRVLTGLTGGANVTITGAAPNLTVAFDGGGSSGFVTSVSGTANQVTSTGGADPILALASPLTTPGSVNVTGNLSATGTVSDSGNRVLTGLTAGANVTITGTAPNLTIAASGGGGGGGVSSVSGTPSQGILSSGGANPVISIATTLAAPGHISANNSIVASGLMRANSRMITPSYVGWDGANEIAAYFPNGLNSASNTSVTGQLNVTGTIAQPSGDFVTNGIVKANNITNNGVGAPNFPNGLTGTTGTFSGNVGVGGTLTAAAISLSGALTVPGTLTANGLSNFSSTINSSSEISFRRFIANQGTKPTATLFAMAGAGATVVVDGGYSAFNVTITVNASSPGGIGDIVKLTFAQAFPAGTVILMTPRSPAACRNVGLCYVLNNVGSIDFYVTTISGYSVGPGDTLSWGFLVIGR